MWLAIAITVVAAAGNNVGKALQKQATKTLPRLVLKREVVSQYLGSSCWVAGLALDVAGGVLMVSAFALAPVSVVQPVSAVGLVFLMLFSHFYLGERMSRGEWVAASTAGIGILGLGASSSEPDDAPAAAGAEAAAPGVGRILCTFLLMVAVLGLECWWRQRALSRQRHAAKAAGSAGLAASVQREAAACGLEAGACFGFSAASTRTGFQLATKLGWLCVPLGIGASIMLTSSGFILQTRGLKTGNTVVVCTLAAVASMLSGVLAGLLALGEQLPSSRRLQLLRLASWALILLGVAGLAGGPGASSPALLLATCRRSVAQRLPLAVRQRLPRSWLVSGSQGGTGQLAGHEGEPVLLPVTHVRVGGHDS